MGMTILQKILFRNSGKKVGPGDIVDVSVDSRVARDFGLVFMLSDKMQEIYKNFGIDLPAANGDLSFELPIPATYVVAANNIISYAFVDADYTNRLDPEIIIEELRKLISA